MISCLSLGWGISVRWHTGLRLEMWFVIKTNAERLKDWMSVHYHIIRNQPVVNQDLRTSL